MVAVRSTGLAFDTVIGYQTDDDEVPVSIVSEEYLNLMVRVSGERFRVNEERIGRFRRKLLELVRGGVKGAGEEWEDKEVRRDRKREEGLARQRALQEKDRQGSG